MESTSIGGGCVDLDPFGATLYAQHLEQCAAAYERKVWSRDDDELTWLDADDFDQRIEVHLDAMVIGDERAVEVCRNQVPEVDFGGWFAGIALCCRLDRQDLLEELLGQLDVSDEENVNAVSDALAQELPAALQDAVLLLLFEKGGEYARIAAHVCMVQRLDYAEHREAIDAYNESSTCPVLSKAISRGQEVFAELLSDLAPEKPLALGVLGDIRALPELIGYLADSELAEDVALGLFLITGADLYEEVFVPREIDLDTLFEEELEKYKKGELYALGEEPGETVVRISQNPETWQAWWDEHQQSFDPSLRYRNGKPFSPASLIENLRFERSPRRVRRSAYKELVIRYGVEIAFDIHMPVKQQLKAIAAIEKQIPNVEPGQWHMNNME